MTLAELDEFAPNAFLGYVRSVPAPQGFIGEQFLPNRTIPDIDFEYFLGANKRPVMAHIMGFDSEAPLHGRPGLAQKVSGELPPIKRKARIGEKEIIRFLTPRVGTDDQARAVEQVYQTTGDLLDAVQARVEWLRLQALSEDKVIYDESGVKFQFDFGIDDSLQIDLSGANPVDGTGADVTAKGFGKNWKDLANSNPVRDLQILNQLAVQKFGRAYSKFVASGEVAQYLPNNLALKKLARGGSSANATADSAMLTPGEINSVFAQYQLPEYVPYDTLIQKENADGTYSDVRPLASNKSFLVTDGFSSQNWTLWGPTAESRILYGTALAGQAPGIWAQTYSQDEPPAEYVKAAAIAFPSMPEANQIAQVKLWA